MRVVTSLLFAICISSAALAVQVDEILPNAVLEARARNLSSELRCLVCQNQSIDDSDAPLAKDLRLLVRERLTAGDTDQQVQSFLVSRYGEFILLKPQWSGRTYMLWLFPIVCLSLAGTFALRGISKRTVENDTKSLTSEEQARLDALLESPEK